MGPCNNPYCKSFGMEHPNCMCHGGMAEGGEVSSHYCDNLRSHQEGCEYFAHGGEAKASALYAKVPKLPVAGLEVSAPEGLDAFLKSSQSTPVSTSGNMDQESSAPTGLDEFIAPELKQEKYGSGIEQGKAFLEGAAQGLVGPIAPAVETALGVNPEDIRGRAEANPVTHYGSEIAGLALPALVSGGTSVAARGALGTAAKLTQAGALEAITKKLLPVAGETLASKIGVNAAKAAIENMLISGSDEASKLILRDPNQSAETALVNVGLSGALGAGLGGAAGALSKGVNPGKTAKLIEDFKGRILDHLENPDPVSSMSSELSTYYSKLKSLPAESEAYKAFEPSLKAFESKFTANNGIEKVIDPGKVNTYLNQLGKPNAEIKQSVLKNFLEGAEKFKDSIHKESSMVDKFLSDSNELLGQDAPKAISESLDAPMNTTMASLDEKTLGSKLADAFIEKGLKAGAASGVAASVGGSLGHLIGGLPGAGIGVIIGEKALTPFFNSVIPALAKSLLLSKTSPTGFNSAVEYALNVAKGEALLSKSTKAIFKAGSEVLPDAGIDAKDTGKLDKLLKQIQVNPEILLKKVSQNDYLPEHDTATSEFLARASTYLNTLRPKEDPVGPLDGKVKPSSTENYRYQSALNIAQNPLKVLAKIKEGTLTHNDITDVSSLYPSLYNRMKEKMMEQVVDAASREEAIPYKTRIGLSMFMAQPLDSTMQPSSIQAAQSVQGPVSQEDKQQAAQQSQGVKSSPALQKMPGLYQTPSQTKQQRAQKL